MNVSTSYCYRQAQQLYKEGMLKERRLTPVSLVTYDWCDFTLIGHTTFKFPS